MFLLILSPRFYICNAWAGSLFSVYYVTGVIGVKSIYVWDMAGHDHIGIAHTSDACMYIYPKSLIGSYLVDGPGVMLVSRQ